MTQHTPGPWRVGDAGHTVFGPPNGNPSPKTIASGLSRPDARLIAAAPELLEAATLALAVLDQLHREGMAEYHPVAAQLRASVAKTTGG